MKNNLLSCKTTRKIAADSLSIALEKVLSRNQQISEIDLRDAWLLELQKYEGLFPDGWYIPPPHGIGILFSTDENTDRTNFDTLREENYWPRNNVFLNKEKGLIMVYASPVSKEGIIGDFGLNIYFGKDEKIINHFKNIYSAIQNSFSNIKPGMKLSELFNTEYKIFLENNLTNEGWVSVNDPTGINTGHTIPFLDYNEQNILQNKNWETIANFISKKRKFVNRVEDTIIKNNMALTIEPRVKNITNPNLPTIYFHTIVVIDKNGEKELLTNFEEIFRLARMDYLLVSS